MSMFATIRLALILLLGLPISGALAQNLQKLKVAEVVRSQLFAPLYVAINQGFFREQGLELDLVTANGGDRVGALVLSGQVPIGLAGPEVAIYLYNSDAPDKPVLFASVNGTDGFFFVAREKAEPFDWSKLRGRRIIGWRPGSTPQLFFEYVLKQKGVDSDTIKNIVTNIAPPAREGAWLSGDGDFGIFNEPATTNLLKAGRIQILASIGKELGPAENTDFFANKSWLEANRASVQKFTNAIARAESWIRTATGDQIAAALAPHFPGLPQDVTSAVMKRYREINAPVLSETPTISRAGMSKLQDVMVLGGVLPANKTVPYEAIVATDFALEAERATSAK